MNLERERKIAINSVLKACKVCYEIQHNLVSDYSIDKNDKSPVTIADFASQVIINKELTDNFPYPIVAEEDSSYLKKAENSDLNSEIIKYIQKYAEISSKNEIWDCIDKGNFSGGTKGRFWTLDPIDGTKGFLRMDQYAVALALIDEGEVILGILGCPNLKINSFGNEEGCILVGEKGNGTYLRTINSGKEIGLNVSDISDPSLASFCESVESSHSSHDDSAKIAELLNVRNAPVRIDSQCKYAVIAKADASIYLRLPTNLNYREKIWDHAAGYIIVKEAGGEVTDCTGKPLDFSLGTTLKSNIGIICTNGNIHDKVIKAVNETIKLV